MASEPSAQPWCLHKVRHSTTIKRIDMSKNPILFRTPATAVDGESVEPSYVQFELSHEGLKSWQEQCEIFKTREWLQSMRSMSLPAGLDWDGLGPINSYSDRKSTRLNSSHYCASRMPSFA